MVGALALPTGAGAAWTSLGTSGQLDISDLVGTARGSDGRLHVAWTRRTPDGLYDLLQTPVAASGAVDSPTPIVTGWASVEGPTLLRSGSALFAAFSGTQTLVTGDPTEGVDLTISADQGATWTAPKPMAGGDFAGQRDASFTIGVGGAITAWYAGRETVVHVGDNTTLPNERGYGSGTGQAVVASDQSALVAWCTDVQGANGVFVQPVDPLSGVPAGAASLVPGSTTIVGATAEASCPATARVPLVARQGKGSFVATVDGARRTVYGWPVGAARSLALSQGTSFKQYIAAAASPGAKASVWVGWLQDGRLLLRRSNGSASVFGATVAVAAPSDGSVYGLDLDAQADRVDLVARVQHDDGSVGLEHAQSFPGLTLLARSGRRPSFQVLDAGDPVAGAHVTVAGHTATTGSDGRASITVSSPGRYSARATAPEYVGATAHVSVRRS